MPSPQHVDPPELAVMVQTDGPPQRESPQPYPAPQYHRFEGLPSIFPLQSWEQFKELSPSPPLQTPSPQNGAGAVETQS